jgi:glycyl-tRNA synthetase
VTIDFDTLKDGTVTLRERDSTKQIRTSVEKVIEVVRDMNAEHLRWEDVEKSFPAFSASSTD